MTAAPEHTPLSWTFRGRTWTSAGLPRLMGIVNVTPDSFSDGGEFLDPQRAVDHALELVEAGADLLDIGGESTRPGSQPVPSDEQIRRVLPVVERLRNVTDVPLSIDTTDAEVARRTLEAGADVINDISGLTFDPEMVGVCAASDCGVVCMHIQGTPQTMQDAPHYDDVVPEVQAFLAERLEHLAAGGIDRERVVLDPGIGFGKTAAHNLELMHRLPELHRLGRPVLIGHSRKRFLGKILGRKVEERTAGTIGVSVALAALGADLLRVHDVRAVRDALVVWRTLLDGRLPE